MAEFCVDCWNRLNGTDDKPEKYILSRRLDLCEGCGEYKHVIITERGMFFKRIKRNFKFWMCVAGRCLILPYLYYRYKKQEKQKNDENQER